MPKCGIFINFVFYRQSLKNERIPVEKKQKEDKNRSLCRDITFICHNTKFSITTELEEYFEERCHNNPEICHDILKVNGEGIVSQHYFLCCNIIFYVAT